MSCDINMEQCSEICPIPADNMEEITDSFNNVSVEKQHLTIYIAGLLERLIKEMIYEKYYDPTMGQFCLNITPPKWFYSLDNQSQKILIKLIEPVLAEYLKK
tara:strand:- start:598 stop:903 length:306 start_codon:yes stop_codon:yes gene_type:complete